MTWLRGGAPLGKVVLGSDIGEGCGKSMSVIIVRDNAGILEINAAAFESKIQTADMICALQISMVCPWKTSSSTVRETPVATS